MRETGLANHTQNATNLDQLQKLMNRQKIALILMGENLEETVFVFRNEACYFVKGQIVYQSSNINELVENHFLLKR